MPGSPHPYSAWHPATSGRLSTPGSGSPPTCPDPGTGKSPSPRPPLSSRAHAGFLLSRPRSWWPGVIPRAAVPPAPPHTICIPSGWGALSRSQFQHKPALATEAGFACKNLPKWGTAANSAFFTRVPVPRSGEQPQGPPDSNFPQRLGARSAPFPLPAELSHAVWPHPPPRRRSSGSRNRGQERGGAGGCCRLCR